MHPTQEDAAANSDESLRKTLTSQLSEVSMERLRQVVEHSVLRIRDILAQAIDVAWDVLLSGELRQTTARTGGGRSYDDYVTREDLPEPPLRLTPAAVPVPPKLAELFGYPADARFVAFHWEPVGDELVFDDGRASGMGEWYAFERWREHAAVAPHLQEVNLGYSDREATHWLIVDRQPESVYVAHVSMAQAFLQEQHPPLRVIPKDKLHELETFVATALRHAVKDVRIDPDQIERAARARQQAIEQMLAYLDNLRRDSAVPPHEV